MKVFIVLEYRGDIGKVVDVFAELDHAQVKVNRLEFDAGNSDRTYHILTKTVKGLHGIKFAVHGKYRTLIPYGKLRGNN